MTTIAVTAIAMTAIAMTTIADRTCAEAEMPGIRRLGPLGRAAAAGPATALLVLAAAIGPAAADPPGIGATTAVVETVRGQLGVDERRLVLADPVFTDERVQTGDNSASQIRFADQTVLSLGANAQVVLDRFVYDPGGTSSVVINATRGALRFTSGLAGSEAYRIQTPTATIGVRGTEFYVVIGPDGDTWVSVAHGLVQVADAAGRFPVAVPAGYGTDVAPGSAPTPPTATPNPAALLQTVVMDARIGFESGQSSASRAEALRALIPTARGALAACPSGG